MSDSAEIVDNTSEGRIESEVEHMRAELDYRVVRGRLVIAHTAVPDEIAGKGLGGKLVSAAVDKAVREGLTVVPVCPFAIFWLRKHSDAASKVAIEWPEER
jgi:predicted GNAT family acetyltransferase